MLTDKDVAANLAVKDLKAARGFYEQVLGLQVVGNEGEQLVAYRSGRSMLLVYQSQFAGTNKATAVTDMKREGDVHVAGDLKAAWFKDPDGNILSIVSG